MGRKYRIAQEVRFQMNQEVTIYSENTRKIPVLQKSVRRSGDIEYDNSELLGYSIAE